MAWADEMNPLLRTLVNDLVTVPQTYSDDTINNLLVVAGKLVAAELEFTQLFSCSVQNGTITPDPTLPQSQDDDFCNLTCIKAACIIDRGEARTLVNQGLLVKDGSSVVDLRSMPENKLKLIQQGWCKVYDVEKFAYQSEKLSGAVGAIVLSPYRLFARDFVTGGFRQYGGNHDPLRGRDSYLM